MSNIKFMINKPKCFKFIYVLAEHNEDIDNSDSDDDDIDINLVYEEEEISTSHLKEFDCTTKKPRRKRRKPKSKPNGGK